jgi:hypothetical protein
MALTEDNCAGEEIWPWVLCVPELTIFVLVKANGNLHETEVIQS